MSLNYSKGGGILKPSLLYLKGSNTMYKFIHSHENILHAPFIYYKKSIIYINVFLRRCKNSNRPKNDQTRNSISPIRDFLLIRPRASFLVRCLYCTMFFLLIRSSTLHSIRKREKIRNGLKKMRTGLLQNI